MTTYPDLFAALAAPFEPHEVKVRNQAGFQFHYVTARTVMNRLDSVLGPENWWDEFVPAQHSVLCKLSIRLPDGTVLTKCDAGGNAGMLDPGDDDKSAYSDAFKRAAVKFGVARYLYRDGVPEFVKDREPSVEQAVPAEAVAAPTEAPAPAPASDNATERASAPKSGRSRSANESIPRSGRALFAWTREQEDKHQVGLLKYLNRWGKMQEYPGRMVDWDSEQVAEAYKEAVRKLQAIQASKDEAYEEALSN